MPANSGNKLAISWFPCYERRGAAGIFVKLPKAQRCELGVEDPTTGEFGWPSYDDRGKENLV